TFVQGLALGMGLPDPVTSPTFVLVHEYRNGAKRLFHLDPFRLEAAEEIADLGFDEMLESGTVVVEWADRLGPLTPPNPIKIAITVLPDDARVLEVSASGSRFSKIVDGLKANR